MSPVYSIRHPVGSEWCKKLTPRESGPPGFDSCFCAVVTGSITVDTRPARVSMDQFHERVSTEATGVSRWFTLWIIGSMYEIVRLSCNQFTLISI